ncbi:hypothetical protein [Altererythrobacter sp. GH1-8]|uniref:hypothetical protein n=1 Tax=Altererythrobacter sp. GH1-8 TaxID=3349333 RepID=UPI00374CD73A
MRIALLSTLASIADGSSRAFLPLGGRPLIAWQIDLAKALGCKRLLCLGDGDDDARRCVEREAAKAGLDVEFLGGPRHLLGKITADQDIVVIADGLLLDPQLARQHFAERRGVAAIPDYPGVEKGFERIDPERAWAGLLVVRGSVAEQLSQMPADADTMSLLLRLALQGGTRIVELDELHLGSGELLLARGAEDLSDRERTLLDNSASHLSWAGPAEKIAGRVARGLAPDQLRNGPAVALAAGLVLMTIAVGASLNGWLTAALAVLAASSFSISVSQALRLLRAKLLGRLPNRRISMVLSALVDTAIIVSLVASELPAPLLKALLEPAMLVGLWRLLASLSPPNLRPFWRDRTVFALILAVLAGLGILPQVLPALLLILLSFALVSEASARLTRV